MSHFQTRVKNFFAIRENFFSRRPFGHDQLVGANDFMRLFNSTVKHFPQKNLWICSLLTDYSINMPKRHRKMFAFFSSNMLPPQKVPLQAMPEWGPRNASPCLSGTSDTAPQNCRRSLPGSYLFQPIDGGELPMTALYLAFLLRRADLSFVRIRLPCFGHKKSRERSPLPGLS